MIIQRAIVPFDVKIQKHIFTNFGKQILAYFFKNSLMNV